jgi:hypothetical protein
MNGPAESSRTEPRVPPGPPPPAGDEPPIDPELAARTVLARLDEIRVHAERLFAVQVDRLRLVTRESVLKTGKGLWLGTVLVAATVGAVAYLLSGLAGGLAVLFGDRPWAGDLAVGAIVLGGIAIGLATMAAGWRRASSLKMKERYRRWDDAERRAVSGAAPDDGPRIPG